MFEDFNQPQQTFSSSQELPKPLTPNAPSQGSYIPETPKPNRRKSVLIGIIIFAILIVLVAGALVGYNYLTNKNKNTNATVNANIEANANIAINQNINANLNANANINLNSNINLNANLNSNINAGVNTNVNTATTDSDNDGLTDEKESLYGTNPNNPDTDSDGYKDGTEIENRYSPNGTGRLSINDFKTFCQNTYKQTLTEPLQPLSSEEIVNTCNSGVEIFDPILKFNTGDTSSNMDTVADDLNSMCDNMFGKTGDKNANCKLGLLSIFQNFGSVK